MSKPMDNELEIQEVIERHSMWMRGEKGGKRLSFDGVSRDAVNSFILGYKYGVKMWKAQRDEANKED